MVVFSNRRNCTLSFLQVDRGAPQLAGNWPNLTNNPGIHIIDPRRWEVAGVPMPHCDPARRTARAPSLALRNVSTLENHLEYRYVW
jgi:hypothetical protein